MLKILQWNFNNTMIRTRYYLLFWINFVADLWSPSNGKLSDFSFYIDSQKSAHRKFKDQLIIQKRKRNLFQWKIPNSLIIYSM
jgi:hypothetical protein